MQADKSEPDEAALWVSLSQIQGLGNANICQLLTKFGSPDKIFSASISQLREVVSNPLASKVNQGVQTKAIQPTLDWLKKNNTHIVTLADTSYPQRLLQTSNPPVVLYAIGNLDWLNQPAIAMVGSRNATPQGEKNASDFAQELCNQGLCIVSGMALGIDGAAHRGALKNNGATIAVVGTGLDIVYPAKHRDLAHKIAERGLVVSEFPLGTPSKAQNFPRRNRIISGLSLGCLVVEANIKSGSLITARLAAEQGREVFAIPGSIHSPVSKGCHLLIKQGAKLVESAMDILDELKNIIPEHSPLGSHAQMGEKSVETNALLASMGFDAINFESLLVSSGLTAEALSSMLMMLELEGKISVLAGGNYQRLI
ncbi:MAG: DNA-processing protein DprA [Methylophilaceae bacterium]